MRVTISAATGFDEGSWTVSPSYTLLCRHAVTLVGHSACNNFPFHHMLFESHEAMAALGSSSRNEVLMQPLPL